MTARVAADLTCHDVVIGGKERERDRSVTIHHHVEIGTMLCVRAVDNSVAEDHLVHEGQVGLGVAKVLQSLDYLMAYGFVFCTRGNDALGFTRLKVQKHLAQLLLVSVYPRQAPRLLELDLDSGEFSLVACHPAYLEGIDQVFACGPVEMYRTMSQIPELKDKSVQISLEIMMACGIGVCYGCTIKTKSGIKQVCQDGPVFEMGEVEWE